MLVCWHLFEYYYSIIINTYVDCNATHDEVGNTSGGRTQTTTGIMAELIEALPTYTTTEALQEHQSATPASFQIPPVLRRKVQDCTLVLRPNRIPGLSYAETGINGDLYLSEASVPLSLRCSSP